MTRISDIYSGGLYNASHFTEVHETVVITKVTTELFGKTPKPVLDLCQPDGTPKPRRLPLNRTNSLILADAFGDEIEPWVGRAIEVWSGPTEFEGNPTTGMMVAPAASNGAGTNVIAMPAPAKPSGGGDLDDEVPF